MFWQQHRKTIAFAVAAVAASVAGCGVTTASAPSRTHRSPGYVVLTGQVPTSTFGVVSSRPAVPSSAGKWQYMPSATAVFPRTSKVEILATGTPGVRFNLGWQVGCGGTPVGKRGVVGGSGRRGDLTLKAPALVLLKLPPPEGSLTGCYLATMVALHEKSYNAAKAIAPQVQIIHY
jgi:hypothetical protein